MFVGLAPGKAFQLQGWDTSPAVELGSNLVSNIGSCVPKRQNIGKLAVGPFLNLLHFISYRHLAEIPLCAGSVVVTYRLMKTGKLVDSSNLNRVVVFNSLFFHLGCFQNGQMIRCKIILEKYTIMPMSYQYVLV